MGITTYVKLGCLVVMMLCGLCSAESAETVVVRGRVGEPVGGFRESGQTDQGVKPLMGMRQRKDCARIEWKTEVIPAALAQDTVTFAWSGAVGLGPATEGNFTVSVNGHEAADFDAIMERTRFPGRCPECQLYYDVRSTYAPPGSGGRACDSYGNFYLTVPKAWVKPGEAALIRVDGKDINRPTWFALTADEEILLAVPRRAWRVFKKEETIPYGTPLPAGVEASLEWYRKQYPDPGRMTTVGPPGDPAETAVSLTGQLLTSGGNPAPQPIPETSYIANALSFALLKDGKAVALDRLVQPHQSLVDGYMPMVTTEWADGELEIRQTAFGEPLRGDSYTTGLESTLAWAVFDVTNQTDVEREVVFLAAQTGDAKTPKRTMSYEHGVVMENGSAQFSARLPDGVEAEFFSVFPADAKPDSEDPAALLRQGGLYNALVMRARFKPGETKRIVINRVLSFPGSQCRDAVALKVAPAELLERSAERSLENAKRQWKALAAGVARFQTPDESLNRMVAKGMLDGYFLTKRWDGKYIVYDSVCYRCQWDDASTKWFYALDLMGDHETSAKLLDTVFSRQGVRKPIGCQTREGCFSDVTNTKQDGSAASWASCNGWALWSMANHARLTNDRDWLAAHKGQILAGADWIIRERQFSKQKPDNPCAGLISGKFVCDMDDNAKPEQGNVPGVGYFTYTDAISYMGLHETARLLADWGCPEGEPMLREAEEYRRDLVAAVDRLIDRSQDPWYVPWALHASKYDHKYLWGVCGPISLAYGGVLTRDDPRIGHVIRWNIDKMHNGHTESSATASMFYSQDLACVLLEQGRVEDFLRMFYAILAADVSHETFSTGEWGGNTQPHVHSISSMVRMFRTMMIQERDGSLYLLQGTPRRWLEPGKEIRITEAPTEYGPLSLHAAADAKDGRVRVSLDIPSQLGEVPIRLKLRLPLGKRLGDVAVNGQPNQVDGDWIVLRGLKGKATIEAAAVAE